MTRSGGFVFISLVLILAAVSSIYGQTTEFVYGGQLQNASAPANGNFDFEFLLFNQLTAGTQIGSTLTKSSVAVAGGIFSVKLDFGSNFPGATRFLEIHVRQTGAVSFTPLTPRQQIESTPYSIKTLNSDTATNATQLGGVAANQYTLTTDLRLSDARNPLPGSASYVQNSTGSQPAANFNISGNGTAGGTFSANIVNAATQYNISGGRVLSVPGFNNVFAGFGAGNANTSGSEDTFVGQNAGSSNTTGDSNTFIGENAGFSNTFGSPNLFVGTLAGFANTAGSNNSFLGPSAGQNNTMGTHDVFVGFNAGFSNTDAGQNSFVGSRAGQNGTTGANNAFFGFQAGLNTNGSNNAFVGGNAGSNTTTGGSNTFLGAATGSVNTTGSNNTVIGVSANVGSNNLSFATAIGANAVVSFSNSVVLGRAADTVRIPGDLVVSGSISKGSGSFRIDHPLDPENKYLYHSFVESPDMMNVYNGNIVTNEKGEATVKLPDYFEALNRDFRYQLTVIGQFAQAIVATEMKGNQFTIKTDKPNVKVSWQVTGIRHDKFADDERIKVEQNKPADERGKCIYAPACQNVRP